HALRADWAMNVRGIAQQKTAPVAEANCSSVVDAICREPAARLDLQILTGVLVQNRNDLIELQLRLVPQFRWEDCHQPPVVLSPHGKQQMEALSEQVNVHFVWNHVARHFRIRNKKHMLVRRSGERYAAGFANGTAGTVTSGDPRRCDLSLRTIHR